LFDLAGNHIALFAWLINRTFSANEQYFSLSTNQSTVLSAMAYQPIKQGTWSLVMPSDSTPNISNFGARTTRIVNGPQIG